MDNTNVFEGVLNFNWEETRKKSEPQQDKKKKKVSERFLEKIEEMGFNMNELKPVLTTKGSQLIISCAGSGKTTSLVFKLIYNLLTGETTRLVEVNGNKIRVPDRIWVSTFLKSGARELEERMSYWQRTVRVMDTSSSISFSTIHAEFKRALNDYGVTTRIISESDNMKLLKEVVDGYAIRNDYGRPLNKENYRSLSSALAYTRNRIDGKRYDVSVYNDFNMTKMVIDAILRDWKDKRMKLNYVDFDDLQEELFYACCKRKDPNVIEFLQNRYSYLYIDEFQDISQVQYEVLKVYISGAKKVVAIGDDDQTIYSWRGSCNDIITKQFAKDFNPEISKLSLNFRCPSNILNAVIPSIEKNENRFKKDLKAARDGGVLRVGSFPNYKTMADNLIDNIYEDMSKGMSVAILCRVNSDGLLPAMMLDRSGKFMFSISGEGMTLDSYVGRLVLGIVRLLTESYSGAVEASLSLITRDKYGISKLINVCKNNRTNIWLLEDSDLAYSCPSLYDAICDWRQVRKSSGDMDTLYRIFEYYRTVVFYKDSNFNRVCRSVILAMESLLSSSKAKSAAEFLDEIEDVNDRLKGRKNKKYGGKIQIATVHEFKGKEADSVYIWNDTAKVYPSAEIDDDSLEQYEEERRIHYIACTRARKVSTIMYLSGQPGDFISEMDLSAAEDIGIKEISNTLKKKIVEDENLEKLYDLAVSDEEVRQSGTRQSFEKVGSRGVTDKDLISEIMKLSKEGLEVEEIVNSLEVDGYTDLSVEDVSETIREHSLD